MFKPKIVLTLTGAALLLSSVNSAKALTLADLMQANAFIDSGDKRFTGFSYSATGDMPPANSINVLPFTDANGNYGIEYHAGFTDIFGGGASTAALSYMVCTTNPNWFITGAYMQGNPAVSGGNGSMQITKSFDEDTATLNIHATRNGSRRDTKLTDINGFANCYRWLHVHDNITANSVTGLPTLSFLDQTFSQTYKATPEPGSVALLGTGVLSGLGLLIRRRKKA